MSLGIALALALGLTPDGGADVAPGAMVALDFQSQRYRAPDTNLALWSDDITNAAWTKSGAQTATSGVAAPDGTLTASQSVSTSADPFFYNQVTAAASTTYTGAIWLRTTSAFNTKLSLADQTGGTLGAAVDVALTTTWQRFTVTATTGGAATGVRVQVGGFGTFTNGNVIQVWRAKVTQGQNPGASILTTTAAVTLAPTSGYASSTSLVPGLVASRAHTSFTSAYAQTSAGRLIPFVANVPRITDLGYLCEKAATNLILRSGDITNVAWTKQNATAAAGAALGPDGTLSACSFTPTTTPDPQLAAASVTVTNATVYTLSLIVAAGSPWSWFELDTQDGAGALVRTWINLSTGALGTVGHTSANVLPLAQGFYLVSVTYTTSAVTTRFYFQPRTGNNSVAAVTGDGVTAAFSYFNSQLELGSVATSPVITGATTATRAADVYMLTGLTTGITNSLVLRAMQPVVAGADFVILGGDSSNLQGIYNSGGMHAFVQVGGVITANVNTANPTANVPFTVAARYTLNNVNAAKDGALGTADTSSAPASYSNLGIGPVVGGGFGGGYPNGYIQGVYLFAVAENDNWLTNASLYGAG